jgi:hypothetical protein
MDSPKVRHARLYAGHPRLRYVKVRENVDDRDEARP